MTWETDTSAEKVLKTQSPAPPKFPVEIVCSFKWIITFTNIFNFKPMGLYISISILNKSVWQKEEGEEENSNNNNWPYRCIQWVNQNTVIQIPRAWRSHSPHIKREWNVTQRELMRLFEGDIKIDILNSTYCSKSKEHFDTKTIIFSYHIPIKSYR